MMRKSPAQLHKERMRAKAEAENNADPSRTQNHTGYELQLVQLAHHKRQLKGIQSTEKKVELKKDIVPEYDAYLDGILEADVGGADEVVTTLLLWNIDAGRYDRALDIATYCLKHKLPTPDSHKRTMATMIAEEIADNSIKQGGVTDEQLMAAMTITEDKDMPDQVRAKLFKAAGYAAREKQAYPVALGLLDRALALDANVGVKKDIEKLKRDIKTAEQSASNET